MNIFTYIYESYCKQTDGHLCLHYDLCHADHIKKSILFSRTLLLKRIYSENNGLNEHVEDLKKWFRKKGVLTISLRNRLKGLLGSLRVMGVGAKEYMAYH